MNFGVLDISVTLGSATFYLCPHLGLLAEPPESQVSHLAVWEYSGSHSQDEDNFVVQKFLYTRTLNGSNFCC